MRRWDLELEEGALSSLVGVAGVACKRHRVISLTGDWRPVEKWGRRPKGKGDLGKGAYQACAGEGGARWWWRWISGGCGLAGADWLGESVEPQPFLQLDPTTRALQTLELDCALIILLMAAHPALGA